MKEWILKNKKPTFCIAGIGLVIFLFGYYLPKQDCVGNISLLGTSYLFPYDEYDDSPYADNGDIKRFKTRDDALDYCMAQRWDFSKDAPTPAREAAVLFENKLTPDLSELRAKKLQELQSKHATSTSFEEAIEKRRAESGGINSFSE